MKLEAPNLLEQATSLSPVKLRRIGSSILHGVGRHDSLESACVPSLRRIFFISSCFFASPITKDPDEVTGLLPIDRVKPRSLSIHKITTALAILRGVVMAVHTVNIFQSPDIKEYFKLICQCIVVIYFLVPFCSVNLLKERGLACQMIRSWIELSKRHSVSRRFIGRIKVLFHMWVANGVVVVFCFSAVNAIFPCLPPFIGSMVSSCSTYISPQMRLAILITESYFGAFIFSQATMMAMMTFFNGTLILNQLVKVSIPRIPRGKPSKRFQTLVQAVVQDKFEETIQTFREMQVVMILYNSFHQRIVLPAILAVTVNVISTSTFLIVTCGADVPLPLLAFNVVALLIGIAIEIVAFGAAGKIHERTSHMIAQLKERPAYLKQKLTRLAVRSFTPLKIQFGSTSYMERSTCLSVIEFTMAQTANLLLTRSQN